MLNHRVNLNSKSFSKCVSTLRFRLGARCRLRSSGSGLPRFVCAVSFPCIGSWTRTSFLECDREIDLRNCSAAELIAGATLSQTLAVLQDYDNHKKIYTPDVRQSKLLEHDGNEFRIYLQLYRKSLVTVVVNMNFNVQYSVLGATRAMSKSFSTRIAELANVDKPNERELSVGKDHGYIWRLNSYAPGDQASALMITPMLEQSTRTYGLQMEFTPGDINFGKLGRFVGRLQGSR